MVMPMARYCNVYYFLGVAYLLLKYPFLQLNRYGGLQNFVSFLLQNFVSFWFC